MSRKNLQVSKTVLKSEGNSKSSLRHQQSNVDQLLERADQFEEVVIFNTQKSKNNGSNSGDLLQRQPIGKASQAQRTNTFKQASSISNQPPMIATPSNTIFLSPKPSQFKAAKQSINTINDYDLEKNCNTDNKLSYFDEPSNPSPKLNSQNSPNQSCKQLVDQFNEDSGNKLQYGQDNQLFYVQPGNNSNLLVQLLSEKGGWYHTNNSKDKEIQFKWTHSKSGINYESLTCLVNHFEYQNSLGDKIRLYTNLSAYCKTHQIEIGQIMPMQFSFDFDSKNIGQQITDFSRYFKGVWDIPNQKTLEKIYKIKLGNDKQVPNHQGQTEWILKISNLREGMGIHVITTYKQFEQLVIQYQQGFAQEINEQIVDSDGLMQIRHYSSVLKSQQFVLQQFIKHPFLIDHKKCQFIVYLLINQYKQGFISKEFIVQQANTIYKLDLKEQDMGQLITDKYHLYPSDILNTVLSTSAQSKQINKTLKELTTHVYKALIDKVDSNQRKHCFEIFELEYLMDQSDKIWLIEVNTNPKWSTPNEQVANMTQLILNGALTICLQDPEQMDYPIEVWDPLL